MSYYIISYHIISHHITSHHVILYNIISYHIISHHIWKCYVLIIHTLYSVSHVISILRIVYINFRYSINSSFVAVTVVAGASHTVCSFWWYLSEEIMIDGKKVKRRKWKEENEREYVLTMCFKDVSKFYCNTWHGSMIHLWRCDHTYVLVRVELRSLHDCIVLCR